MQIADMAACILCLAYVMIALPFFLVSWLALDNLSNARPYRYVLALGAAVFWPIAVIAVLVSVLFSRSVTAAGHPEASSL